MVALLRLRTQLAAFRHLNRNAPVPLAGALAPTSAVAAAVADSVDSDLVGDVPVDEFERRQFAAEAATQHAMDGRADELQGAVLILPHSRSALILICNESILLIYFLHCSVYSISPRCAAVLNSKLLGSKQSSQAKVLLKTIQVRLPLPPTARTLILGCQGIRSSIPQTYNNHNLSFQRADA